MSAIWSDVQVIVGATAYTPQVVAALHALERKVYPRVTPHFNESALCVPLDIIRDTVMEWAINRAYLLGDPDGSFQ